MSTGGLAGINRHMSLPVVAIVGRPNVGKSSLLNRLARRRIAIVDPTPGVTRDRISAPCKIGDGYVELLDTGGMGIDDVDDLTEQVESQIDYAVAAAQLILFIVDAREGLAPLDNHVAGRLRRNDKPVILLANKIDNAKVVSELGELNKLGFGEPLAISATHGAGLPELRDLIAQRLGDTAGPIPPKPVMKLAIVGRRNVGKSTLINSIAGQERLIVSETPGTTRDSVDVAIELDGRQFVLIDTAGLRKRRKVSGDIEFYSRHRALRSIRRADVVAMLIDASAPISRTDKALGAEIAAQFKPVVLVINKWDLAADKATPDHYAKYLAKTIPGLSYAPISMTVAATGENVRQTIRLAEQLFDQANTRVGTGRLNAIIADILALRGPSHKAGTKPPKILYASQIATAPPTIACVVNDVRSFETTYQHFLVNQLRARLAFTEVPIRLLIRQRRRKSR